MFQIFRNLNYSRMHINQESLIHYTQLKLEGIAKYFGQWKFSRILRMMYFALIFLVFHQNLKEIFKIVN